MGDNGLSSGEVGEDGVDAWTQQLPCGPALGLRPRHPRWDDRVTHGDDHVEVHVVVGIGDPLPKIAVGQISMPSESRTAGSAVRKRRPGQA